MLTGYYCPPRRKYRKNPRRNYKVATKLPYNHRDIDKRTYYRKTIDNAHSYHFWAHNLRVEDVAFRKIILDAVADAVPNRYGKTHKREYLNEWNKFNQVYYSYFERLRIVQDWEVYRTSTEYEDFKRVVSEVEDFHARARIMIDNALAYMYSKAQAGYRAGETLAEVEKALKLDTIQKIWSKKTAWFLAVLLFFDANNLYANTIGANQEILDEFDPYSEAIKIRRIPWYEKKTVEAPEWFKWGAKIYEELIIPISGELGSVALAEVARQGTCIALLHTARILSSLAKFHPALRIASWGAETLNFLRAVLDNTVVAWLGWQIAVEWPLDAYIQTGMNYLLKLVYSKATGVDMHWLGKGGMHDFMNAVKALEKKYKYGSITQEEQALIDKVKTQGTEKMRQILERMEKVLKGAQELQNFYTYQDFYTRQAQRQAQFNAQRYMISQNSKYLVNNVGEMFCNTWLYNSGAIPHAINAVTLLGGGDEALADAINAKVRQELDRFLFLNWRNYKTNRKWVAISLHVGESKWPLLWDLHYIRYATIGTRVVSGDQTIQIYDLKPLEVSVEIYHTQGGRAQITVETYQGYDWDDIEKQWIIRHNFPFFSILNFSHLFYVVRKYRTLRTRYPYAYVVVEELNRFIPLKIRRRWKCFAVVRNKNKKKLIMWHFFEPYPNTYKIVVRVKKSLFWGQEFRFTFANMSEPRQRVAVGTHLCELTQNETFDMGLFWELDYTWGYMKWGSDVWGGKDKKLLELTITASLYRYYSVSWDEIDKTSNWWKIENKNATYRKQEGPYLCEMKFYYPTGEKAQRKSKRSKLVCIPQMQQ